MGERESQALEAADDWKRSETELRIKSQVFEDSIASQSIADREGVITHVNRAFLEMWGYAGKERAVGRSVGSFFADPADAVPVLEALAARDVWQGEFRARRADGTTFISRGYATSLRNAHGELVGYQSTNLDVTRERENERALARSKRELEVRSRIVGVFLTVADDEMFAGVLDVILEVLQSAHGIFGYIDEAGALVVPTVTRHILDRCQVPDKALVFPRDSWGESIWPAAILRKEILCSNERSRLTPKGHIPVQRNIAAPIVHRGEAVGLFQVANKETDYDADDLALAGAIADAIAPILDSRRAHAREQRRRRETEEALLLSASERELATTLEATTDGIWKWDFATGVMEFSPRYYTMLGYEPGELSRVEDDRLVPVSLPDAIDVATNLVFNEIKYRARLVKEYGETSPIMANAGRISQVFLNLLVNAAQAIDEGDVEGNEIRVRTWQEGREILAEVCDTGKGIAGAHIGHLFEPFFTTKAIGVGTGLGLPITKNIVEGYGGRIEVTSEVGRGSRFVVRLPVGTAQEITREITRKRPTGAAPDGPATRGRILVIDDEAGIRSAMARMLREHEVIGASSGEEGREILEQDQAFDLILCDMMMPAMSGVELHEWLVTTNPRLAEQVVFVTGGAFTPRAREYLNGVDNLRVEKPFDVASFRRIVHELVCASRAQS